MELRKVIKFGKATYSITLPKKWVTEQGIIKGDVVRVDQLPQGSLEITPNNKEAKVEVREITIPADGKESEDIYREVLAAYIKNYTIINIQGPVSGKIKALREKLHSLIGLEIMEVGPTKIMAKSFLDVTQTKVDNSIKRIFYNIKSMSEEFKTILLKGGTVEEIEEMDGEVNRNTYFTMKFLFKALEKPELASKMGMKSYEILLTWELVKLLEMIGDKIKLLARTLQEPELDLKKEGREKFLELYLEVENGFLFAMEEYFKKNKKNVHKIVMESREREKKSNHYLAHHKKSWTPLLIDHLKDINMFTRDIANVIIDLD